MVIAESHVLQEKRPGVGSHLCGGRALCSIRKVTNGFAREKRKIGTDRYRRRHYGFATRWMRPSPKDHPRFPVVGSEFGSLSVSVPRSPGVARGFTIAPTSVCSPIRPSRGSTLTGVRPIVSSDDGAAGTPIRLERGADLHRSEFETRPLSGADTGHVSGVMLKSQSVAKLTPSSSGVGSDTDRCQISTCRQIYAKDCEQL